jgi:hypothetical protein
MSNSRQMKWHYGGIYHSSPAPEELMIVPALTGRAYPGTVEPQPPTLSGRNAGAVELVDVGGGLERAGGGGCSSNSDSGAGEDGVEAGGPAGELGDEKGDLGELLAMAACGLVDIENAQLGILELGDE